MTSTERTKNPRFSTIFLILTVVLGIFYYWFFLKPQKAYYNAHHVSIHGTYLLHDYAFKNFNLTDMYGNHFSKQQLKNNWTLLYFGFTHCEIICPNVMHVLKDTYHILETKGDIKVLPKIVFFTIDPERDTPEKIRQFVTSFDSHFLGLWGEAKVTTDLLRQFHVPISKIQGKNKNNDSNDYVFTHGTDIILINPAGNIQAYFTYPQQPKVLAKDYEAILMHDQLFKRGEPHHAV